MMEVIGAYVPGEAIVWCGILLIAIIMDRVKR